MNFSLFSVVPLKGYRLLRVYAPSVRELNSGELQWIVYKYNVIEQ